MPVYVGTQKNRENLLDRDWLLVSAEEPTNAAVLPATPEPAASSITAPIAENESIVRPTARVRSNSALDMLELHEPRRRRMARREPDVMEEDNSEFGDDFDADDEHDRPGSRDRSARREAPHEFDDIDMLTMRSQPELEKPAPQGRRRRLRVAIYARFSSKLQKEWTIKQQVRMCGDYIEFRFRTKSYQVFADRGRTGTNMDREQMDALIAAIESDKIDVVVFYQFDRVSRELLDSLQFWRILEENNVELHCARSERKFTKEDAARAAIEAENDSKLRRERSMYGLDGLVKERKGLPWGKNFGFQKTTRRGQPEPHPLHSETVKRIFRDIVRMSAEDLAIELTKDGVISPSGDTVWLPTTILFIVRNVIYIGRIRYRKTTIKKIHRGSKSAGLTRLKKPRKYSVKANPEWTWVTDKDEKYRLVSDEEFRVANEAVKARTKNRRSGIASDPAMPIFGVPVCDLGTSFNMQHDESGNRTHRFSCSLKKACKCVTRSLSADLVEEAVYDMVVPFLDGILQPRFISSFKRQLAVKNDSSELQASGLEGELLRLDDNYTSIFRTSMLEVFIPSEIKQQADLIEEQRAEIRKQLASLPRISVDAIDFDGTQATLRTGFELLRKRLPFIPKDDRERGFVNALRKGVKEIRLLRDAERQGVVRILISMQWERYFLTNEEVAACGFAPQELSKEIVLPFRYTGRSSGSLDHMSQLAASGLHAMTDEEWSLVSSELPDLTRTDHNGHRSTDTRTVVNCMLFQLRTSMPLSAIPRFFGPKEAVYNAIQRLIAAGGVEVLVSTLGQRDPTWLDGLNLDRLANRRRAVDCSRVARVAIRPTETADRLLRGGDCAFNEAQWEAIAHLFDPRIQNPTGRAARTLDCRRAMEGIFVKLRSRCAWGKMPAGFEQLHETAMAIAYHGAWDEALEVLRREHPSAVADLDTRAMDSLPRSAVVRRKQQEPAVGPTETAEGLLRDGDCAFTDAQWEAIAHAFDRRIQNPTGKAARTLDCRRAMEGIFVKLRSHCAWVKMPGEFEQLHEMATAIAYHGAWDEALEIIRREYPVAVADLDTGAMDSLPRSVVVRRRQRHRTQSADNKAQAEHA